MHSNLKEMLPWYSRECKTEEGNVSQIKPI